MTFYVFVIIGVVVLGVLYTKYYLPHSTLCNKNKDEPEISSKQEAPKMSNNYFTEVELDGEPAYEVYSPLKQRGEIQLIIEQFSNIDQLDAFSTFNQQIKDSPEQEQKFESIIKNLQEFMVVHEQQLKRTSIEQFIVEVEHAFKNYVHLILSASHQGHDAVSRTENMLSQIDSIFGLVDGLRHISDQTGLLALNAAIEAAQSGQVGKSYAYMAEEVKRLSQHSQSFGKDIEKEMTKARNSVEVTKGMIDSMVVSDVSVALETRSSVDQLIGQLQGLARYELESLQTPRHIADIVAELHKIIVVVLLKLQLIEALGLVDDEFREELSHLTADLNVLYRSNVFVMADQFM